MNRTTASLLAIVACLAVSVGAAGAAGLGVEVWTDRGNESVYQPGEEMRVNVRTSDDANLLVYEIDTDGYVRVLFPYSGQPGFVAGGRTLEVPTRDSDVALVVQEPVGQSYLVAVASAKPFRPLPWYLRPYNMQEQALGYVGKPDEEEGITSEGRIVGDPFVAMERIRRRIVAEGDAEETFATAYTTYYVHEAVQYPRYLCYDCHRPNHWAWWDGFDPYYTSCSVFSFRVNWAWAWGPSYWYGAVPYYVYVYRPDCPPPYMPFYQSGIWYSSWDGWNRWCDLWGTNTLKRYKSPPPAGYVPPERWKPSAQRMPANQTPPGFLVSGRTSRVRDGMNPRMPAVRDREGTVGSAVRTQDSRVSRMPASRVSGDAERVSERVRSPFVSRGAVRPSPVYRPREEARSSGTPPQVNRTPQPRMTAPPRPARETPRPAPRVEAPRQENPPAAPRVESPPPQSRGGGNSSGGRSGGSAPRTKR